MLKSISNYINDIVNGGKVTLGGKKAVWKKVKDIKVGGRIAVLSDAEFDRPAPEIASSSESGDSAEGAGTSKGRVSNIGTGTIKFDEIVSIKKVGRERVWDIEVENSHNFVGNKILAHNTYINGNLGVGNSAPTAKLTVNKDNPDTNELLFNVQNTGNNVFSVDAQGNYAYSGTASSPAADYAEYFKTKDTDLVAGEAVCIDILNPNSIARCKNLSDPNIIGIVSTKPAIVGNSKAEYVNNPQYKIIAMLGQIPARVSNENGEIRIGDSLTGAITPGYVMKANAGDSTVGVALESFGDSGTDSKSESISALGRTGTIQVMISRRNKSLTVESVEQKVTERIAGMKIEDEVNILVSNAIKALQPQNALTLDATGKVILANDPTQTVDILANNAEIRNITDSLITLQSDYETLKNTIDAEIDKINSEKLTSVFEKIYITSADIKVNEIVSQSVETIESANNTNKENVVGIVTSSGAGRITVKTRGTATITVTKESGEIKKGDAITVSSSIEGVGSKAIIDGMIIGYALADADYTEEVEGTVKIAISPIWYQTQKSAQASIDVSQLDLTGISKLESLTVDTNSVLYGDLNVLGNSSFTDIFASGKLAVGMLTLSSEDSSINVVGEILKLQNEYGAGNIEAFGGKIVFTSTGDLKVLAEVTAKKYNVDISNVAGASAGKVIVKSGTSETVIETGALTDNSLIFITAESSDRIFTYEVIEGNKIRLYTSELLITDTEVNWWVIN